MSTNFKEFRLDVAKGPTDYAIGNRKPAPVPEHVLQFHKAVHFEASRRIVKRTPRDLGTAKFSWHSTVGSPSSSKRKATINALVTLAPFSISFITNNQDYILVLEEGLFKPPDPGPSKDPRKGRKGRVLVKGGYSVQAPQGMVQITFEELKNEIKA